jgi:hypothetical protein
MSKGASNIPTTAQPAVAGGKSKRASDIPCTRPGCCRQVVRKEVTGCLTYWQHLPVVSRTLLLAVFEILPTCHVSDTFACLQSLRCCQPVTSRTTFARALWRGPELVGTPKRVGSEKSKQETARSRSADRTPPFQVSRPLRRNGNWESGSLGVWKIHCSFVLGPAQPSHRNRGCRTVGVTHMQCGRVSKHHDLGPGRPAWTVTIASNLPQVHVMHTQ